MVFRLLLVGILVCGCRRDTAVPDKQPDLGQPPAAVSEFQAPAYAKHLAGLRICLDPGHGGDAARPNYKRGPTGLREADVNLRVATALRSLLEAGGATVVMTRSDDVSLADNDEDDLRLRAEVANEHHCDLLLSIHHNASDARPPANFTTVWYHANVDYSPASLDVGRELAAALIDGLRLPEQVGCPLLSDYLMYAGKGFRVLRYARCPAVLTEASFHTNPAEEQRLRDPKYNLREAQALFTGLARYAMGGVPRMMLVEPANACVPTLGSAPVVIALDDGLRSRKSWGWEKRMIIKDSIILRVGESRWPFVYDEATNRISIYLPTTRSPGTLNLNLQFENLFKHSNTRPDLALQVRPQEPI